MCVLWTPAYSQAKAGRPARIYIQQLCEDTGCSPEDLPEVMNNREKWWERVRDICASSTTWSWWWYELVLIYWFNWPWEAYKIRYLFYIFLIHLLLFYFLTQAMWMMLQQNEPEDFVIATGETHSVREFVEEAFKCVGTEIV